MSETPSDTADHPFVASADDAVLCGQCGEHTTWHPMTAPPDPIAWLRLALLSNQEAEPLCKCAPTEMHLPGCRWVEWVKASVELPGKTDALARALIQAHEAHSEIVDATDALLLEMLAANVQPLSVRTAERMKKALAKARAAITAIERLSHDG